MGEKIKDKVLESANCSNFIHGPLRYPGGKSKALKTIIPLIIKFSEYREPMVGGGSVFLALKQNYPNRKYWINDKHEGVYLFWRFCKNDPNGLVSEILRLKKRYKDGKELYQYLKSGGHTDTRLHQAARFFILNRITFSGLIESGGYSNEAYHKRFTDSSIERIRSTSKLLQGVKITNLDYSKLVTVDGERVFIFLDPPYYSKRKSKLYGTAGDLHKKFDHTRFLKDVLGCNHNCLITYDNCSKIQRSFASKEAVGWQRSGWRLQYGTNNLEGKKAKIGNELFLSNYNLNGNNR